jgi:hypothetical protein
MKRFLAALLLLFYLNSNAQNKDTSNFSINELSAEITRLQKNHAPTDQILKIQEQLKKQRRL